MRLSVCVTPEPDYLALTVTGVYSLSDFQALAQRVRAEAAQHDRVHILVDISAVSGTIPGMDRFFLGAYVARQWQLLLRVAIVYCASAIDKFFETVAVNRAVQVIVVPDRQAAVAWLAKRLSTMMAAGNSQ